MKICYITQSRLDSHAANTIHVMHISSAMARISQSFELYASRQACQDLAEDEMRDLIKQQFGVSIAAPINTIAWPRLRPAALVYSLKLFAKICIRERKDTIFYSRCLYTSALLILFGRGRIAHEFHAPGRTRLHRFIEHFIIRSGRCIKAVFITHKLCHYYQDAITNSRHWEKFSVLPDAAIEVKKPASPEEESLAGLRRPIALYTGSDMPGKGLEILFSVAKLCPTYTFLIAVPSGVLRKDLSCLLSLTNVSILYGLSHSQSRDLQLSADVLLLPNQSSVLTDGGRVDIGEWTSPLKLFEYMSSRKPIIASDLDVLKEILTNEENCLLADAANPESWADQLHRLQRDAILRERICRTAYEQFVREYSWDRRAERILAELECVST